MSITKRSKKLTSSCRAVRAARPRKDNTKRARQTKLVVADEQSPAVAEALEQLLIGFAHGDRERVHASLGRICDRGATARLDAKANELLESFHTTVWSLRNDFDPGAISMTSTRLPEASRGLDKVLVRAGDAARKVLHLVDEQQRALAQGERWMKEFERQLEQGSLDHKSLQIGLAECRAVSKRISEISSEMVYTQEFEDLCGQVIYKVKQLIIRLEDDIRTLLEHLKVELPNTSQAAQREMTPADQAGVDDILKGFGI
jgi:chemotaxis regulatin CheY-phosphate phosphatase CheZ